MNRLTISSNTLVRNEILHIDGFVRNMLTAEIDEIIFLDGGSTDGSYERLLEYEQKYKHIHVLRWKQPENSEFKLGFKETVRRNLMKEASSMDFILYIDIDERIDEDFKLSLDKIDSKKDIKAVVCSVVLLWNKDIRINLKDDKVWYPNYKFRLLKRSPDIHFGSNDKNGLHNFLMIHGKRVIGVFNRGLFARMVAKMYMRLIGFNYQICSDFKIYHFHYYKLNSLKVNDLRKEEYCNPIRVCQSIDEGVNYTLADKIVPVICVTDPKLEMIIKKYL